MADILKRYNVKLHGKSGVPLLFAHGYGCDQSMWRYLAPKLAAGRRSVTFDYIGMGGSDVTAYDPQRYQTLRGYAGDVIEICDALGLADVVFVGHSVSAMIGLLAAIERPEMFSRLVMIGPSPCYINDGSYRGGFDRQQIESMLGDIDRDFLGWARAIGPAIMGQPSRPELGAELTNAFCSVNRRIAQEFARVTFLSDNRADLPKLRVPSLIIQCSHDIIAGEEVGRYVHRQITDSRFTMLDAVGHCPHVSAPDETSAAIEHFLRDPAKFGTA